MQSLEIDQRCLLEALSTDGASPPDLRSSAASGERDTLVSTVKYL
jgi:hypothetical protein